MALNENAQKWVDSLRSGEFKQGIGKLRHAEDAREITPEDTFCCLGVACELYRRENPETSEWVNGHTGVNFRVSIDPEPEFHDECDIDLPPVVAKWLGLASVEGRYLVPPQGGPRQLDFTYLTNDNDRGATFEEIATIIESEPTDLFRDAKTIRFVQFDKESW